MCRIFLELNKSKSRNFILCTRCHFPACCHTVLTSLYIHTYPRADKLYKCTALGHTFRNQYFLHPAPHFYTFLLFSPIDLTFLSHWTDHKETSRPHHNGHATLFWNEVSFWPENYIIPGSLNYDHFKCNLYMVSIWCLSSRHVLKGPSAFYLQNCVSVRIFIHCPGVNSHQNTVSFTQNQMSVIRQNFSKLYTNILLSSSFVGFWQCSIYFILRSTLVNILFRLVK